MSTSRPAYGPYLCPDVMLHHSDAFGRPVTAEKPTNVVAKRFVFFMLLVPYLQALETPGMSPG